MNRDSPDFVQGRHDGENLLRPDASAGGVYVDGLGTIREREEDGATRMTRRTVLITGGNGGLGYETAKRIVASSGDWDVVIASRDMERSRVAVDELRKASGDATITAMRLDLGSLAAVREFAAAFVEHQRSPLHAIVCNAGLQVVHGLSKTTDGFETTFAVNHLGHFLLVNLLLSRLSPPARIVVVSSDTHDPARTTGIPHPRWEDPHFYAWPDRRSEVRKESNGTAGRRRYTTSKLCNVLFVYELSRRMEASGLGAGAPITVNAYNPGFLPETKLLRDYSSFVRVLSRTVLPVVGKVQGNLGNMDASSTALARLVTEPSLERVTGRYFDRFDDIASSEDSYDLAKASELWDVSVELVELKPDETPLEIRT